MLLPLNPAEPQLTDEDIDDLFAFDDTDPIDWPIVDGEVVVPKASAWSVTDTGSAEFAMRHLSHATAAVEDIKAQEAAFIQQIETWATGERRPHERRINFFTGMLIDYAARLREEGQKTVKLPSGEITSRIKPARTDVVDESKFIEWAKANIPSAIKAKWSPVMAEVKRLVTWTTTEIGSVPVLEDGEVVPGVMLVPEDVSFTVKPAT